MTIGKGILLAAVLLAAVGAVALGGSLQEATSTPKLDKTEKRLNELQTSIDSHEKRLAKLEETLRSLLGLAGGAGATDDPEGPKEAEPSGMSLVDVHVGNKRFQPSDARSGRYEDNIWYDATYTSKLKKKTRSIKGIMQFCDLFGEPKFQIRVTIDDPVEPGLKVATAGVGFEYNQFKDTHLWMRTTSLTDMTFKFRVNAVLYADGTREDF